MDSNVRESSRDSVKRAVSLKKEREFGVLALIEDINGDFVLLFQTLRFYSLFFENEVSVSPYFELVSWRDIKK